MKKNYLVISLFFLAIFSNCIRKQPPVSSSRTAEDTVRTFVQLSAEAKSADDRKRIQELCQGDLRRAFERMNDEAFQLIYLDSKVKILEIKVLESKPNGDTTSIAYEVTIDNSQGTDKTREINQREVELKKKDGVWLISNIRVRGTDQVAFTQGMFF